MIFIGWRSKAWVACVKGWAAVERLVSKGRAAVVLERTENWIRVDLVPSRSQEAAAVIAAEIVAERSDRAWVARDVGARCAGLQDGVPDRDPPVAEMPPPSSLAVLPLIVLFVMTATAVETSAGAGSIVIAESAVGDCQRGPRQSCKCRRRRPTACHHVGH